MIKGEILNAQRYPAKSKATLDKAILLKGTHQIRRFYVNLNLFPCESLEQRRVNSSTTRRAPAGRGDISLHRKGRTALGPTARAIAWARGCGGAARTHSGNETRTSVTEPHVLPILYTYLWAVK